MGVNVLPVKIRNRIEGEMNLPKERTNKG